MPVGYTLSTIPFRDGVPVPPPTSRDALTHIMQNPNTTACPDKCFRPVGLAWDTVSAGTAASPRLFMTSDSTGEVYVLIRQEGRPAGTIVAPQGQASGAQAYKSGLVGAGAALVVAVAVAALLA